MRNRASRQVQLIKDRNWITEREKKIIDKYEAQKGKSILTLSQVQERYIRNIAELTKGNRAHMSILLGVSIKTVHAYVETFKLPKSPSQRCKDCKARAATPKAPDAL